MLPTSKTSCCLLQLYNDPLDEELNQAREELRMLQSQRARATEMRIKEEAHFRDVLYTTMETWKRQQQLHHNHHNIPLKLYSDAVNAAAASRTFMTTSPTILQQQAKLCRSLHMMGIMERQVYLTKKEALGHAKFCQQLVMREQDKTTLMEIDLMSELLALHKEVDQFKQHVQDLTQMRLGLADHSIILKNYRNSSTSNSTSNSSSFLNSRSERTEASFDSKMSEETCSSSSSSSSCSSSIPFSLMDLLDQSIHEDMLPRRHRAVASLAC